MAAWAALWVAAWMVAWAAAWMAAWAAAWMAAWAAAWGAAWMAAWAAAWMAAWAAVWMAEWAAWAQHLVFHPPSLYVHLLCECMNGCIGSCMNGYMSSCMVGSCMGMFNTLTSMVGVCKLFHHLLSWARIALIFSSQSNFFCNSLCICSFLRWLYSPNGERFFECALKEHWFFSVKRGQSVGINIQTYQADVKLKSYGFQFSNKLRQTKKTAKENLTLGTLQERQVRYFLLQSCSNCLPLLQPIWLHDTPLGSLWAEQVEIARL